MKVLVVSGFLGSGKTTFIETLSKKIEKFIVVLENEYGEVGIDGDILKKDDIEIWELTEGCVCCTIKANFATSILTIYNSLNPDLLIVEPTGLGMLSAVLDNIRKIEYERIEILDPITIVDATAIDKHEEEFEEIFTDQIQTSNKAIISKLSLIDEEKINEVEWKIKQRNPNIQVHKKEFNDLDDVFWADLLEDYLDMDFEYIEKNIQLSVDSLGLEGIEFENLFDFQQNMSAIISGRFGKVLRVKGFLKINGVWSRVDIVNDIYTLTKIEEMPESKLVFIGKNLEKDELNILFNNK
ncbi:MAG: GTP-binding protein [Tissierellia bacterium]|jgi:G3E family GTPase|nr:GTP-binding protein [Tissierellia bacterium]